MAETIGPLPQMWARVRAAEADSMRVRLRLQYQPLVAAGAVVAVGVIQQLAAEILAGPTGMVGSAAASAGAISLTLAVIARKAHHGRLAEASAWLRAHPLRAVLVGTAAWVWLVATALAGWEHWQALATGGVFAFYALAAHWWRAHRIGYEPLPDEHLPSTGEEADHYAALWSEHLAHASSGVFRDTALANYHKTRYGHQWDVRIRRGSKGLEGMRNALEEISTALGVAKHKISLDAHDSGSPLLATLRITTRSPTSSPVHIQVNDDGIPTIMGQPIYDPATGDIALGPYADGQGMHTWGLYRANSLLGGYAFGAQMAGKSELLNLLALGMRLSGVTTYWYVDGQEGTQPSLQDTADWDASATAHRRRLALEAAVIAIRVRMKTNKATRAKGFTPRAKRPGLVLILDESHITINKYVRDPKDRTGFGAWTNDQLVDEITRIGRKVGVAALAGSQDTGMGAFGGTGDPGRTIRGNLFSGNVALMYSQDAISGQIAPKAAMSVTELPTGGGFAVAANEMTTEGSVSTRRVMWRAAYTDAHSPAGEFGPLITAAGPCLALEPEVAHAIDAMLDGVYSHRNDVSAAQRADAAAESVQRFLDGELDVTELLFGTDGDTAADIRPPATSGLLVALPDLADFIDQPKVPQILTDVLEAFEAAGDTRMHGETLAAALDMSLTDLQARLREHAVRPLTGHGFWRGGVKRRGYDLEDIQAAAQRHQIRPVEAVG